MKAYDLDVLKRSAHRGLADCHGWICGLPPGITPEQWPLDPNNGYPLMHGFTLLLPDDYRVHGPEIVGLSFFATAPDHNDGGPFEIAGARAAVEARSAHPRLHRMQDILDNDYALVLLTQAEFDGALCQPPQPLFPSQRDAGWMTMGAAASHLQNSGMIDGDPTNNYFIQQYGEVPPPDLAYNRAIRWTPRASDPNAGIAPREEWTGENTGYQPHFYFVEEDPDKILIPNPTGDFTLNLDSFRVHAWAQDHKHNHIGGTMRPVQNIPAFSPYYVEFEEYFGGYNFGGGNAQLDFRDMKFDWACG